MLVRLPTGNETETGKLKTGGTTQLIRTNKSIEHNRMYVQTVSPGPYKFIIGITIIMSIISIVIISSVNIVIVIININTRGNIILIL